MDTTPVIQNKSNTKSAYIAMCGVGIVMLFSKLLSDAGAFVYAFLYGNGFEWVQQKLAGCIKMIFGTSSAMSVAAARHIIYSEALSDIVSMLLLMLTLFLPAYLFSKLTGSDISKDFCVKGRLAPRFLTLYFMVSLFMSACAGIGAFFGDFLFPGTAQSVSGTAVSAVLQKDAVSIFISFVNTAIFVPVVEEYVFRGVFFSALKPYGVDFAVVASSFVFGVMHFEASQSMYAFAFGIFASLTVALTGNIKTAVLFHMLNNSAMLFSEISQLYGDFWSRIFSDASLIITVIMGFWGIVHFFSPKGTLYKYNQRKKELDIYNGIGERKCGVGCMFVVPILIFISYYAISVFVFA